MRSSATYVTGRAHADEATMALVAMDEKWGVDRLRLLVSVDLRERFDRQRLKFNQALWHGQLPEVIEESNRMVTACSVLDKRATEAGASPPCQDYWEAATEDGTVIRVMRSRLAAPVIDEADTRRIITYTFDEVVNMLNGAFKFAGDVKAVFGGDAEVVGNNVTSTRAPNGGEKSDSSFTPVKPFFELAHKNSVPRSPLRDVDVSKLDDEIPF
jgi:hypothetical protein